jgi:cyanophycinase
MVSPHRRRLPAFSCSLFWDGSLNPKSLWGAVAAVCAAFAVFAGGTRAEDNVLGLSRQAVRSGGSLVICGGGTMEEAVYDRFVELAGGKEAHVVLIPTAYPFSSLEEIKFCYNGWRSLDVASIEFLDTSRRAEADEDAFIAPLQKATGVWLAGGQQSRLIEIYGGTKVEEALHGVLARGGVIGGTSAGAAVMSKVMICQGRSTSDVMCCDGFGLLGRAVVDQHFGQRKRLGRLLSALYDHPANVGLGIDENTALVVQGDRLAVLGEGSVTVCMAATPARPQLVRVLKSGEEAKLIAQSVTSEGELESVRLRKIK